MWNMFRAAAVAAISVVVLNSACVRWAAGQGYWQPAVRVAQVPDVAVNDFQAQPPNGQSYSPNGSNFTGNESLAAPYDTPYATSGVGDDYSAAYVSADNCGTYCESGMCTEACCEPRPVWSATIGGLLLNIDDGSHYNFSYDDADESLQFTDWHNTETEWDGGFEVVLRRLDPCTCSGCELVYWQLFGDPVSTTTTAGDVTGNLNGILNWDQLDYNGDTADTFVDSALAHRLRRDVELYNIELNRAVGLNPGNCSPWNVHALWGARLLRFEDELQFASDTTDGVFNRDVDEIYYDIETENMLYGLQAGLWSQRRVASRFALAMGAKAGVFGNHITGYSRIGGAAGTAIVNNGPNNGREFLVDVDKDDVAMLAELQCELQFALTQSCYAGLGYRVIGVSGVAISVDQIYHDLRGIQDVEQLDSDGTLFLHGVRVYMERQF